MTVHARCFACAYLTLLFKSMQHAITTRFSSSSAFCLEIWSFRALAASFSVRGLTTQEMRRYYNSQKYKTTTSCVMATKSRASIKTVSFAIFGRHIEVEQWRKLGQTDPLILEYSNIPPRHVVQVRKRLDINIKSNSVHQVSLCAILSFSRFSVKTPGTHISKIALSTSTSLLIFLREDSHRQKYLAVPLRESVYSKAQPTADFEEAMLPVVVKEALPTANRYWRYAAIRRG
jgi:hypothetical protein